jgi:hypothetical protein
LLLLTSTQKQAQPIKDRKGGKDGVARQEMSCNDNQNHLVRPGYGNIEEIYIELLQALQNGDAIGPQSVPRKIIEHDFSP